MRKLSKALILFTAIFSVINISNKAIVVNAGANDKTPPTLNYSSVNNDVEKFYTSTSSGSVTGLKGDALLEQLAKILEDNHKYYNNYGELRGGMAYSDEDPNNPSNIIYFYSGISHDNTWGSQGNIYNREHVWCKANSGGLFTSSGSNKVENSSRGAGADIHHLRPEDASVNSSRSNKKFADLNKQATEVKYDDSIPTGNYQNSSYFEPRDGVKGDVARILMYLYTHYSTEVDENKDRANVSNSKTASQAGALTITSMVYTSDNTSQSAWDLLVKWNELDPVDDFEMDRNDYCTAVTGVRNPFIDHPEFARLIWSSSTVVDQHSYTLVNEKPASCKQEGTKAHYTCSHCDKLFIKDGSNYVETTASNLVIAKTNHTYTEVKEEPAKCNKEGTKAHYTCNTCDKLFVKDGSNYVETTASNLVIAKTNHTYSYDCDNDCNECGYIRVAGEHKDTNTDNKCDDCNEVINCTHTYTEVKEEPAKCNKEGTKAHYICNTCNTLFVKDGNNYVETNKNLLVIAKTNHTYSYPCDANCNECNEIRTPGNHVDENNDNLCDNCNEVLGCLHTYQEVKEEPAKCNKEGTKAHYVCNTCNTLFVKDGSKYVETTAANLVIAKTNHTYSYPCDTTCNECNEVRTASKHIDENLDNLCDTCKSKINGDHVYTFIEEVKASCTSEGCKAHYECSHCGGLFIYEDGKHKEVSQIDLLIRKEKHDYYTDCDSTCNTCGATREVGKHIDENKDNLCDKCRKLLKNNNTDIILISVGVATGTIIFIGIYYLIKLLMK